VSEGPAPGQVAKGGSGIQRILERGVARRFDGAIRFLRVHRTFILLFLSYFYFFQGGDPNQSSRFLLTRAMVERHAFDITPDQAISLDKGFHDGKFYSDKAPGISFAAVVPYAGLRLSDRLFHLEGTSRIASRCKLHVLSALLSGLPTTIIAFLLFRVLCAWRVRRGLAELCAFAYGVGTIAFPFATLMFGHQLAAVLVFGSFAHIAVERAKGDRGTGPTPFTGPLLGLAFGTSIVVEYPTGMLCAALGVYFLLWKSQHDARTRSLLGLVRAGAPVIGTMLVPLALHSLFLYAAYGAPFKLPYKYLIEPIFTAGTTGGFLGIGVPTKVGTYGTLISPYRGFLFFSPFLALAIAGFFTWFRKHQSLRAEGIVALASILMYLVFNTSYYAWDGGGSFGPRHLLPATPYMVLAVGLFANEHRAQLWLFIALLIPSIACMLLGTSVLVQLPEGDAYLLDPIREVYEGAMARSELSLNPQDSFLPELRGDASYNLGTLFGLSPRASLVALVAMWCFGQLGRLTGISSSGSSATPASAGSPASAEAEGGVA
jgi:hypothetical protein